ncbi:hypothetical protein [Mycobacterium asiaticum]|uniref:Uncharacterized protein n=1 Tax=Mycobacterium asiaticum TaxID=1790 RepID=A0A1A3IM93_MYCAS|nr:hypothetical protein [Mycobacterium asiaticum]OBI85998.1 hypothetical protein A5661_11590 [Mycobacterium asiaticum]OBJ60999.1 hypothetical protein A9W94_13435 [Mycobacterium asiaticum]OBJ83644.1 hypothetical protein A5640_17420 [Mycobacterium asiaticum]ORA17808.1 hypothetical protein BST16_02785 [Mycobacterium asiaticum DSM 44297]
MTKAGLWLNAILATIGIAAFVFIAGFFGYKWLARDEVNRSYSCGSGSRGGTCFEGEAVNMLLTFVFGGLAVLGIVLLVRSIRFHRRGE